MSPQDAGDQAAAMAVELAGERRVGLGCMALTGVYGAVEREIAVATLYAALDSGVRLFDTAALYGNGANEKLLGEVLGPRDDVVVATKFGLAADAGGRLMRDSSPGAIRRSVEASLRRIRRDSIDLLYQHRQDPATPPATVAETVLQLMEEGKVARFGLSRVGADEVAAWSGTPLAAVQNEMSVVTQDGAAAITACRAIGSAFIAHSPLGRGLATASVSRGPADHRSTMREFQTPVAERRAPGAAAAVAWVLARDRATVAIPGCRSPGQLREVLG